MRLTSLAVAAAAAGLAGPALAQAPTIVMEEMMVPSSDPGIEIYVRNKRPANMNSFQPERTVVFVHGSTYPAHTAFDLKLDGQSWMDYMVARGYDVYLLDLRGYGKSTRPKEMEQDPKANPALVRGGVAVRDIGSVVDFVLKRRNIARLNLLGHSWGTVLMATYTTQNPGKVERLMLYAPVWIRNTPSLVQTGEGPVAAYRLVTQEQARARRMTGVPEAKKTELFPAGWFETWAEATWATDPKAKDHTPPAVRAPNGTVQDSRDYWAAGKAYYDPAKITVPTLLVLAEWDQDTPTYMAQTLFPLMVNSPGKRMVVLGEGTHSVYMEKNRMKLFEAVQSFLDEAGRS